MLCGAYIQDINIFVRLSFCSFLEQKCLSKEDVYVHSLGCHSAEYLE